MQAPDPDSTSFMSKYALIKRDSYLVHLSSHNGDGVFGNVIYVQVSDIDPLHRKFVNNRLNTHALWIPDQKTSGRTAVGWLRNGGSLRLRAA